MTSKGITGPEEPRADVDAFAFASGKGEVGFEKGGASLPFVGEGLVRLWGVDGNVDRS